MLYEKCYWCDGSGLILNMIGEPDICPKCKGNTVLRAHDKKGRFTK